MQTDTNITQEQLDLFKGFYPNLAHVQALTLDEVKAAMEGQSLDWNTITPADLIIAAPSAGPGMPTACQMAVGAVIFDVICLAVGAAGLRSAVRPSTIEEIAGAAGPVLTRIEVIIAKMSAKNATKVDLARGVFEILDTIYTGGVLDAVFDAFTNSLTWWNMMLYGVSGLATIVLAFATDGLALAAEIVIMLATFGFLVTDLVAARQACSLTPTKPPSGPAPQPGEPYKPSVAISTINGPFVTVVNNGGLGGPDNATSIIHSDARQVGPWEKFTLVPLDMASKTFALQTKTGNYVTATNGGGLGGPDDATSIIHTDATAIGLWESLALIQQTDGTYAICTTSGYYLTAVDGGGLGGPNDATSIIHTDSTVIGPWETFAFNSLPMATIYWECDAGPEWQWRSDDPTHFGVPCVENDSRQGTITLPLNPNYWYPCIQLTLGGKWIGYTCLRYFAGEGANYVQAMVYCPAGGWNSQGPISTEISQTNTNGGFNLKVSLSPFPPLRRGTKQGKRATRQKGIVRKPKQTKGQKK